MKNIIFIIEVIIYTLIYRYMFDTYGFKAFLITFIVTLFAIIANSVYLYLSKGEK